MCHPRNETFFTGLLQFREFMYKHCIKNNKGPKGEGTGRVGTKISKKVSREFRELAMARGGRHPAQYL
jgi:hypothetical protein